MLGGAGKKKSWGWKQTNKFKPGKRHEKLYFWNKGKKEKNNIPQSSCPWGICKLAFGHGNKVQRMYLEEWWYWNNHVVKYLKYYWRMTVGIPANMEPLTFLHQAGDWLRKQLRKIIKQLLGRSDIKDDRNKESRQEYIAYCENKLWCIYIWQNTIEQWKKEKKKRNETI